MGVQFGLQHGQDIVSACLSNCTIVLWSYCFYLINSSNLDFFSCYKEKARSIKDSFWLQPLGLFSMHISTI